MPRALRHLLGISAYYHDSAAVLLRDGQIIAAAQEERFSRRKNDERFPGRALEFCLRQGAIRPADIDAVVFYDKPITKFARMLETYLAVAPFGLATFPRVLPAWLSEKLNLRTTIREEIPGLASDCPILFTEHHQAHAASAFYPSPFDQAAIITVDGVGEWATTTIGQGRGDAIQMLKELRFPHSLGLLYSAFTAYCGFRVNSGEYKLMGLAPYGQPKYAQAILDELIDLRPDGSFWLNLDYFHFLRGMSMTNQKFHDLFGGPPRAPEGRLDMRHADVARSIQTVTEEVLLRLARHAREITGERYLCLAGGVALNCVANGLLLREKVFDRLWIQPAAGDAGGALGAALMVWHHSKKQAAEDPVAKSKHTFLDHTNQSPDRGGDGSSPHGVGQPVASGDEPSPHLSRSPAIRFSPSDIKASASNPGPPQRSASVPAKNGDTMQGALLGPEFSDDEIESVLRSHQAVYERLDDESRLDRTVALLQQEKVIGWVQGRMEFGPRALGNRSIIGDPRSPKMQSVMNLKVKFRESFRPFAPIVLRERVQDYFELDTDSPYMLLVAPVHPTRRKPLPDGVNGFDLLKSVRSEIPAVTHVDYSARIQTVCHEQNPLFYSLLRRFEHVTGCGVLVNTSFNVRGEPIICTPDDAYRCLVNTEMDYLVIGHFLLERMAQPHRRLERSFEAVPD